MDEVSQSIYKFIKKAEQDLARLTREKWEYYTGKADPSVYQAKPFNIKTIKTRCR